MKQVDTQSLAILLRGASLLSCGGGLSYPQQQVLARKKTLVKALRKGIPLISASDLPDEGWCITISEVGEASAPVMDKSLLPRAVKLFTARTGKKVIALIPGEIGQETICLESAAILQLPIVDADLSGCRAVPRLTDLALVVRGIAFTMSPLVVVRSDGNMEFVSQQASLSMDEENVRRRVPKGQVVTLLGAAVSGKTIKDFLDYASYTKAMTIGKALLSGTPLSSALPTACLFGPLDAVVEKVREQKEDGFSKKQLVLRTQDNLAMMIEVENEYMRLAVGKESFSFPQLIMLCSKKKQRGLHSSEVHVGDQVTVIVADAFDFWKGKNV